MDAIAQYSADALFRHDMNYDETLLNPTILTPTPTNTLTPTPTDMPTPTPRPTKAPVTPTPTNTPTPSPTPTPFPQNTAETWKQLAHVIGADDFTVVYAGASIPEDTFSIGDSYYALTKIDGYEYLAIKFSIKNDTKDTLYLKTSDMGLKSLIMINGTYFEYETTTLFLNDLYYIGVDSEDGTEIKSGARYNGSDGAVVVFKVPEDIDIQSAGMLITNKNNDNVIIKIQ